MFDVTDYPDIKEGDVVTIYGVDEKMPIEFGAGLMNTISYELLCVLARRIPRVYLDD